MPVNDNSQVIPVHKIPDEDEIISTLPKMISDKGLCKLWGISHGTFRGWMANKPFMIPRGINVGSEKKQILRFYLPDVMEKMMEIREKFKYDPKTTAINRILSHDLPDDEPIPPMPAGIEIVE